MNLVFKRFKCRTAALNKILGMPVGEFLKAQRAAAPPPTPPPNAAAGTTMPAQPPAAAPPPVSAEARRQECPEWDTAWEFEPAPWVRVVRPAVAWASHRRQGLLAALAADACPRR